MRLILQVSGLWIASVICILCCASLITNLLALKNYRKSNQNKQLSQPNTQPTSVHRRFELQLFVFGIAIFFIMLPISIAEVIFIRFQIINCKIKNKN
jgi:hypothetical protein